MRESYETIDHWRRYQSWFPPQWRCEGDATPSEEWWRWRGCDVHLDRFAAPDAPTKVLVLHGGGGYGRLLAPLGVALREHGYEALAPDLPGFGLTRVQAKGSISYGDWIECVGALVEAERSRDERPLVLFGASLGGMLAYEVAARTEGVAGVAATCLLDPRDAVVRDAVARNRLLSRLGAPLMQALAPIVDPIPIPIRLVGKMDRIANDHRLARLCATDPVGGGNSMPTRFLRTYLQARPAVEPEDFSACPILLAHPGEDHWTPLPLSKRFFDRLASPKRLVVLARCGHLPVEEPGVTQLEGALVEFLGCVS